MHYIIKFSNDYYSGPSDINLITDENITHTDEIEKASTIPMETMRHIARRVQGVPMLISDKTTEEFKRCNMEDEIWAAFIKDMG